jgi:prophage maintenance system killer protein
VLFSVVVFQSEEDVDAAHEAALSLGGGESGVLNRGMVISATMAPRNGYYGSLAAMAAAYLYGIAKAHGYKDGNKRTAAIVLGQFLGSNGFDVELTEIWPDLVVAVAEDTISRENLDRGWRGVTQMQARLCVGA